MPETKTGAAVRTIQPANRETASTILQRIAGKDKSAVAECLDEYGNFIWTLAKRLTDSDEAAETATQQIFIDIWNYAERGGKSRFAEKLVIGLIARRRLIKHLPPA